MQVLQSSASNIICLHRIIGSDLAFLCQNDKQHYPGEFDDYLNTRRRKRSQENIVCDNHYNQTRGKTVKPEDPVKSKLCQAPRNITKNQKMLKTGLLNLQGGPLFFERLELKIPEMRYNSQSKTKDVIFPNAKFSEGRKKSVPQPDKWKGWNKQLRSSLKYWQKRFPCTELTHCSHSIRK